MPSFFRVFRRDGASKSKKAQPTGDLPPSKPKWEEAWLRTEVQPEEVQKLINVCTHEMKSRALDMPFLLLPFRPGLDPIGSKNFVRQYFKVVYDEADYHEPDSQRAEAFARRELRLMEPIVLCSIMKWCWARLPGGVVTWETYDLFKAAEVDSNMAKNAFDVFIPMSTDSEARKEIIYDFFDLMAAVAARGKTNGLGGRKLSRYAGWWAFEHSDQGLGFDGGYKSWANAADATSHLFFAYLRSLAPEQTSAVSGISKLPRSLQALLSQTEYPPETPTLMQSTTTKVVMIVQEVSPTPFSLLRRARNFEYRDDDRALQEFSDYEDPVRALSDECRRVLESISSTNQSAHPSNENAAQDPSWSRFEDMGFSSLADSLSTPGDLARTKNGLRTGPGSVTNDLGRPTTPSWADFLSTGFPNDRSPTLLPPDKQLPLPVTGPRAHSSQSHRPMGAGMDLEPGELASITHFDLDETFWWVWMTSLAAEEPGVRKAVFGRCALIETHIHGAPWLLIEEQVKGASPGQEDGVYLAEKKSRFGFTRRGRLGRRKTTTKKEKKSMEEPYNRDKTTTPSSRISPEKHQQIQAAAKKLARGDQQPNGENGVQRRSRLGDDAAKTNSTMSMGTLFNEAGAALKWTNHYDQGTMKEGLRQQYLLDPSAGRGAASQYSRSTSAVNLAQSPHEAPPLRRDLSNRDLPALPQEEPRADKIERSTTPPPTPPQASKDASRALIGDEKVPPTEEHPALRASPESKKSPAFSPPSPELRKPVPKQEHKKLQKNAANTGGFKKFFGRKKQSTDRADTPTEGLLEGKPKAKAPVSKPIVVPDYTQPPDSPPRSVHNEPTFNAPSLEEHDTAPHESERDEARRAALERLEADQAFSTFDQGPMEDMPAFVPEDESDEDVAAPPPVVKPAANQRSAAHLQPEKDYPAPRSVSPARKPAPAVRAPEPEVQKPAAAAPVAAQRPKRLPISAAVPGSSASPMTTSDRWAQIRKNAAERAQRVNDEQQQHGRQNSASARSDEGDTSGEETIESRVARIKARVAELTGNMDTTSNSAARVH